MAGLTAHTLERRTTLSHDDRVKRNQMHSSPVVIELALLPELREFGHDVMEVLLVDLPGFAEEGRQKRDGSVHEKM